MEEVTETFLEAMNKLEEVADSVTPEQAVKDMDEASLQVFWRDWPRITAWAGDLWRRLDSELADRASPVKDPDMDEVGGPG